MHQSKIMKIITSQVFVGWCKECKHQCPSLLSLFIWSCVHSHKPPTSPSSLCSRRDSVWRPSSVSVLNTQSLTVAYLLGPLWQMCRKSTRSLRSCSSLMRSLCLKKPSWALTQDTGATGKTPSLMQTWQAVGVSLRAVPASLPPGAPGMMNYSATSPGLRHHHPPPFRKLPANPLI